MRNPFGWSYPAGAENDPNAPWNQSDDHAEACPCNEDSPPFCVCGCEDSHHNASGLCDCRKKCECEGWNHDKNPDCICDDLSDGNREAAYED